MSLETRFHRFQFVVATVLVAFALATGAYIYAQQQREKSVQKSVTREHGRVVEVQSTKLRKFDKPVTRVPTIVPPKREGHSWHWHPHYGWIAIAVETAPREVLLPVTYQMPATVIHYELTAGAAVAGGAVGNECQLTCPHCGEVITISVR